MKNEEQLLTISWWKTGFISINTYSTHYFRSSTEYKTNLLNLTKASAEKCKSLVRKIRQNNMSKLKKMKSVSKDDIKMLEKQVGKVEKNSIVYQSDIFFLK